MFFGFAAGASCIQDKTLNNNKYMYIYIYGYTCGIC